MSRPVDEKIAKLTLDNKDFTRKASESMSIFQKLTARFASAKKINLNSSVKSLNDVNVAASKIDLRTLANGASMVSTKFTAMGAIAVGALMRIGSTAVTVGANLLKSFTMDPITQGFGEYEEKMNAIQVILSNTEGKSNLDDVKASLADLNTYADKTIYSFSDMTKNMGTFTAAGVDLKTAQTAIKGIGNLAAVSGSNAQQAGTAMYQLSQAIAAGKVGLQDWNSVVNAGMGGAKFQNALKANAKGFWDSADASLSFRDSLQEGWLTTEVLMKTLNQFAKDDAMLEAATKVRTFSQLVDTAREGLQSGWATTWELIFGDFKESGDMWTQIGDAILTPIQKSADARNKLISDFNELGGRSAVITTLKNAWNGLNQVFGVAKDAFHEIFPPATAQSLANMAKRVAEFSKNFKMSGETANQVKTIFKGVFSIFSSGIEIAKRIGKAIMDIIPDGVGGHILDFAESIAKLLLELNASLKAGNSFTDAIKKIVSVVGNAIGAIANLGSTIANAIGKSGPILSKLASWIGDAAGKIGDIIGKMVKKLDINDALNVGFISAIMMAVKKFKSLGDSVSGFLDGFTGMFDVAKQAVKNLGGLTDVLEEMTKAIQVGQIVAIAASVTMLAISMKLIAGIPAVDIAKSLEVVALSLVGMVVAIRQIAKLKFDGTGKAAGLLIALSLSILGISAALKVFASINADDLGRSMLAMAASVGTLVTAIALLNKFAPNAKSSASALLVLSTSLVILSSAVKILSTIDTNGLVKAVTSLGAIFLELGIFLKIASGAKFGPGQATGLLITTGAILTMVGAIKLIADIPVNNIVKGLATIGTLMLSMGAFTKIVSGSKVMGAATGMVLVAGALNLMVGPIEELGSMSLPTLAQGLIAMAIALGEVVVAMKLASGSAGGAAAILIMAGAIAILVPPLEALGNLSIGQVATALGALAGAFAVLGVAAAVVGPLAPALLILAAAIGALGLAVAGVGLGIAGFALAISSMAAIGGAAIAAFVGTLGLLLAGLTTLIPEMVKFGVTAVTEMAQGLATAAPQLASSALELILGFLSALNEHVPKIIDVGLQLITNLANSLADNVQPLIDAGVNLIVSLVNGMANGLRENQGEMVAAIMNITEAMLEAMITGLQAILDTMFGWIPGFKETTSGLGDAARSALREKFNTDTIGQIGKEGGQGFVDGVNGKSGDAKNAGANVGNNAKAGADPSKAALAGIGGAAGTNFASNLSGKSGNAKNAGANVANNAKAGADPSKGLLAGVGRNAGSNFAGSLSGQSGAARGAGNNLSNNAKSGATSADMRGAGRSFGGEFAGGVGGASGESRSSGRGLGNSAKSGANEVDASSSGANFGEGFATGISGKRGVVETAARGLANVGKAALESLLKIFSPSRVMRADGGYFGEGFALGIEDKYDRVNYSSKKLGQKAVNGMDGVSRQMQEALEFEGQAFLQPVIKPIFDFSNFILPDWKPSFTLGSNVSSPVAPNIEINITTTSNDPTAIANEVEKVIVRRIQS